MKDIVISATHSKFYKPDKFTFVCRLSKENRDAATAKDLLKEVIESKITPFLKTLDIDQDTFLGEYSLSGKYSEDRGNVLSVSTQIATYSLFVESKSIEYLKDFYNLIISEPKSEVVRVSFGFSNIENIERELIKKALEKIEKQKNMECEMLAQHSDDLKIITWKNEMKDQSYSALVDNQKSGFNNSGCILDFEPKQLKLTLNLTITYSR